MTQKVETLTMTIMHGHPDCHLGDPTPARLCTYMKHWIWYETKVWYYSYDYYDK